MKDFEPITIINVDEVPYAVSDMTDDVKRLVNFYNDWRQEEAQIKSDLLKVQAAMRDLSREIIQTIKNEKAAKDAEQAAVQAAMKSTEDSAPANDGGDNAADLKEVTDD